MAGIFRRVTSATTFTSPSSTAGSSRFNGSAQPIPCPVEGHAAFGATRGLQLSARSIEIKVDGFISHARLVQKFRSTDDSRNTDASCSFQLPPEAAVIFFKLEIGDDDALEGESRPTKRARKQYNQAVRSNTLAARLEERKPGIFQTLLGRIRPGVRVSMEIRFVERLPSNPSGELTIKYPPFSPSTWSSSREDTQTLLNIEIHQEDTILSISSPRHEKLLSVKAGVRDGPIEVDSFAALRQQAPVSTSEPNKQTVNLSLTQAELEHDLELTIKNSNTTRKTAALLSAPDEESGLAVLAITIRPRDLFKGKQETEWSVGVELDGLWEGCSDDLRQINLTKIPHCDTSVSRSTCRFVRSPKVLPTISHRQIYSVFYLLDFKGSPEDSMGSVHITATPVGERCAAATEVLTVKRNHATDRTLEQLCVSSILRDVYSTMKSREHHHSYLGRQSLDLSHLDTSAKRLSRLYNICNHWSSKIATESTNFHENDADTDSNGPLSENEFSRLSLPTSLPYSAKPAGHGLPQTRQIEHNEVQATKGPSRKRSAELAFQRTYDRPGNGEAIGLRGDPRLPPRTITAERPSDRLKEYFLPGDGIAARVIMADICLYLGNDAKVRPGTKENRNDSRPIQGYIITAHNELTRAMVDDLRVRSICLARWTQETDSTPLHSDPTNAVPDCIPHSRSHERQEDEWPVSSPGGLPGNVTDPAPYYLGGMCVVAPQSHTYGHTDHFSDAMIRPNFMRDEYARARMEQSQAPIYDKRIGNATGHVDEARQLRLHTDASYSAKGIDTRQEYCRDFMGSRSNPGPRQWLVGGIPPRMRTAHGSWMPPLVQC